MRWSVLVLILLTAGCAVMTPEQCEYADWMELGERDGRDGRASDYIATRAQACRKAGIAPDATAYRIGWDRGIAHYCTLDQGFQDGFDGRAYGRVCPAELEPEFLTGYGVGYEIHRARVARDAEDRMIQSIEAALADPGDRTEQQIRDLERDLDLRRVKVRRLERELGLLEGQASAMGYRIRY